MSHARPVSRHQSRRLALQVLYAADLAYLQELYNRVNRNGKASVQAICPKCEHGFEAELDAPGES